MVDGTRMNNFVLVVLLLSNACFGTTPTKCSWGTWSQWNCTCCGNSVDQPVYRNRTQCCPGTTACGSLHITAEKITSSETDLDNGTCMHDCRNAYRYNINKCRSVVPTNERNSLSNAPASCDHVCIGSLTTTKRDTTRVTDVPAKSSHDTITAERVTTVPIVKSGRSLTTTKRDSTRVTDVPPNSSHDTIPAEKVTTVPIGKSGKNLASRVSSHLVLWIAVVSTTVLCLLALIPI